MARRTSWAHLPMNCRENVLLRISWCDVCRLRAVSKGWNTDLEDPIFRPESQCLLTVPHRMMPRAISTTANPQAICIDTGLWQFLEIATGKVFYAYDTFITKALQLPSGIRHTMAASGGLIYVVYDDTTHIVCNLMQNEYHQIPAPPTHPRCPHSIADMVADGVTEHYKIVHIGCNRESNFCTQATIYKRGRMDVNVYDSTEKAWRHVGWRYLYCKPIRGASSIPSRDLILNGVNGVLYKVYQLLYIHLLFFESHDLYTGLGPLIGIQLPQVSSCQSIKLCFSQAVAASNCLFFVEYSKRSAAAKSITVIIWKIALGEKTVTQVAHLPKFTKFVADSPEYSKALDSPVLAVGCGDSIIVSSFCGRRCRWDVLDESWHEMERFLPVEPLTACHSFLVAPFDISRR